jgi:hypothetical protein
LYIQPVLRFERLAPSIRSPVVFPICTSSRSRQKAPPDRLRSGPTGSSRVICRNADSRSESQSTSGPLRVQGCEAATECYRSVEPTKGSAYRTKAKKPPVNREPIAISLRPQASVEIDRHIVTDRVRLWREVDLLQPLPGAARRDVSLCLDGHQIDGVGPSLVAKGE